MFSNNQYQGQVYYDAAKGQYYTIKNPTMVMGRLAFGNQDANRIYIGEGAFGGGLFGKDTASTRTPAVNFNQLPRTVIPQATPYQRPTMPQQGTPQPGSGFVPQFDMQALMQAIQARQGMQAGTPMRGPATLTPGAAPAVNPMMGGLAALRGIAGPQTGVPNASK
jgi:hypothetical protein